jgi:hypothetical protein
MIRFVRDRAEAMIQFVWGRAAVVIRFVMDRAEPMIMFVRGRAEPMIVFVRGRAAAMTGKSNGAGATKWTGRFRRISCFTLPTLHEAALCGESEDYPRKAVNVFGASTLAVVNL